MAGNPNWGRRADGTGKSGHPNGLPVEVARARVRMLKRLSVDEVCDIGFNSYVALLADKEPVIVRDFMDRIAGKAKEHVEVTGQDGERLFPEKTGERLTAYIDGLRAALAAGEEK